MKKILIVGAGNMGESMLRGWIKSTKRDNKFFIREPKPSDWLIKMDRDNHLKLNPVSLEDKINTCIFAVKPQLAEQVLKNTQNDLGDNSFLISVIAGKNFKFFDSILKNSYPVIRVMPNTPVSVGSGVSAIIGNKFSDISQIRWTKKLFGFLGKTVILEDENLIDAVTAISGSGPAYIFNYAENLIEAAKDLGLTEEISKTLVLQTIIGAGLLAFSSDKSPSILRENVTSPNGTTQAALDILMDKKTGWKDIIKNASRAAYKRSKELANN